jgi:phosphatidylserine decarboxylase
MLLSSRERLLEFLQRFPTAGVSRIAGRVARVPVPQWARGSVWRGVSSALGIDLDEAAGSAESFGSFDQLFTRRLKEGLRPAASDPRDLASPADGRLTGLGSSESLEAKGRVAELGDWLSVGGELPWERPRWAVIYLGPNHYHRVHAPASGRVERVVYTPGSLLPVNPIVAGDGRRVFGRNERLTIWLSSDHGPVAVAMIGAMCVGGMSLSFDGLRANQRWRRRTVERVLEWPFAVQSGDELGTFHIGSTVIVAWEGRSFAPRPEVRCEEEIRLGAVLGRFAEG